MSANPNYPLYPKRCTLTQRGFAIIPLLILIVVGIASGVYLTQTGPSFLPKAANQYFSCTPDLVGDGSGSQCPAYQAREFAYCNNVNDPVNSIVYNKTACDAAKNTDPNQINYYCKWTPSECPVQQPPIDVSNYCTLQGIKDPGSDTDKIIRKNETWTGCDRDKNKVLYLCLGDNKLGVDVKERSSSECGATQAAPAAAPATNPNPDSQPISEAGGCTKTEAESCKGICYKDTSGKKQCTASKENSSGCSEAQQKLCTDKKRNSGCMIIRGEVKCLYSEGAKCDSDDSNACSQGCAVVQREGQWVSECKATVCSQGYHNFCMATKNKSCEIKDGVPDCTGDPSKAPKPAAAAVTAPRSGAGAPAAGNQPQNPQQTATANTPKPPAAPLICGKDENLNDIPCYAMGVFSNEELKTREAQAKIASVNYTLFRQILDNEAKEIDAKVKENARAKIAAAEEAMKACLK